MTKSYSELMKKETGVGIQYNFPPINPVKHNQLLMKAINLFGETGLFLLIGKIESAGNDILQTTWFIQAMQRLCKIDPVKVSEFQMEILSYVQRSDLNDMSGKVVNLDAAALMEFSEFQVVPGINDKMDGILLLNRLTISALEEYVIPFVGMLLKSDISRSLTESLTTWLHDTAPMSTGSSGGQSTQESSPLEATKETQKKPGSRSGIFTRRGKS